MTSTTVPDYQGVTGFDVTAGYGLLDALAAAMAAEAATP